MKKFLFLSFLLAVGVGYAQCASIKATKMTSSGSIGLSSISAPTDDIIWVSANSSFGGVPANTPTNRQVAVSTNGGTLFTPRTLTLYSNVTQNNALAISNVCGVSATTAFIAAHGSATAPGGIWKTTDAGVSWVRQSTASYNTGTDSFTNLVHFWDENNGVAMGDPASGYFEIYTTNNGGVNWVRTPSSAIPMPLMSVATPTVPSFPEYGLTNQFSVTGNTIWLGTTFGRILKSIDKGLTWTAIVTPIPGFSGGESTNAPAGFNANQDWKNDLVGSITTSLFEYYRTSDGGLTWVADAIGVPNNFGFKYVPGTVSTVICVGDDVDSTGRQIQFSTDDGATWTPCPDTNGGYGGILEVRSLDVIYLSGFQTSGAVGGLWKVVQPLLSVNQIADVNKYSLTPNPTADKLTLSGSNINEVQITDILGKVVFNNSYSALSTIELNIAEFNAGLYLVKVTNNEGKTSVVKVVKQ